MTVSEFRDMLLRYGPVVDSWPAAMISPGLELLRTSSEAQDLFAQVSAEEGQPPATGAARPDARRRNAAAR